MTITNKAVPSYKSNGRLTGHTGGITALCFHSNNQFLSASHDATIKVWHHHANTATLKGHLGSVTAMSLDSNNSSILASGSSDRTAKIWDLAKHALIATLPTATTGILSVAIQQNFLAYTTRDNILTYFDLRSASPIFTYQAPNHTDLASVQLTPQGPLCASHNTLLLFSPPTPTQPTIITTTHSKPITKIHIPSIPPPFNSSSNSTSPSTNTIPFNPSQSILTLSANQIELTTLSNS
ncbi:hypothetical protein NEHOM01_2538, partial [Nematocida homosporus]|uniref:uncharacterized protein n=1 Tax=Nematocida homosporus TaxID=1912981 RepID=UPI002220E73F